MIYSLQCKSRYYSQRQHINKLADGVNKHGYVHRIICSIRHSVQSHSLPNPALISKYIFHQEYELEIVKLFNVYSKIEEIHKYIVDESQVSHSLKKQHKYGLKRYLCAHICTHPHISSYVHLRSLRRNDTPVAIRTSSAQILVSITMIVELELRKYKITRTPHYVCGC